MKHLKHAKELLKNHGEMLGDKNIADFIDIQANILLVPIQDGTIPKVGINGVQVTDLLKYVNEIYKSLNAVYPCKENANTIQFITNAIKEQHYRTVDREARGVEGKNKV